MFIFAIITIIIVVSIVMASNHTPLPKTKTRRKENWYYEEVEVSDIQFETDPNYGADADGNRGISITWVESFEIYLPSVITATAEEISQSGWEVEDGFPTLSFTEEDQTIEVSIEEFFYDKTLDKMKEIWNFWEMDIGTQWEQDEYQLASSFLAVARDELNKKGGSYATVS